ncbi:DegV family protein [Sporosarcina sp. Te-1]|uniref:DegV family protein n=1 Tax=Sporosarcina sp. Te-1 TaxID=2818390 RepID=UPI001A9CD171|nr:DegV family protein [Sporosarcina sp. Te-1]QTD42002.1 DegV family protein [Sporosarcina sp. Te-1]
MKKIHIVTDSTADLIEEHLGQYDIHVVPLTIQIEGKTYQDGVDLQPASFLDLMREAKELPKSSQPAAGVFKELYDRLGADGSEIISIHMTGGMSGTVKSAEAAAQMSDSSVTVIDSMYISHALTFQVVEAAKMAKEGRTVEQIVERLSVMRKNTTLFVVVDMLDNLVKGGRIGKGKAMIGSLLNIKPIAILQDGVYTPVAKARSHKQVVSHLFKSFKEETAGKIIKAIGISHANGLSMAEPLKRMIEESGWNDVKLSFTTPIISTHTGEGAIGFMYYTD